MDCNPHPRVPQCSSPGDAEKPANGAEEHPTEETQGREGIGKKGMAPVAGGGLPTGFGSMEVEEDQDLGLMRESDGKVWTQQAPTPSLEVVREAGLELLGRVRSRDQFLEDWVEG